MAILGLVAIITLGLANVAPGTSLPNPPAALIRAIAAAPSAPIPTGWLHGASINPLPLALSATNDSGPLVTPTQAREIAWWSWSLFDEGLGSDDTRMVSQVLEPGLMLREVLTQCAWPKGEYCPSERWPISTDPSSIRVFVPRQTSYPLDFLALIPSTGSVIESTAELGPSQAISVLAVLERTSATATWKIAFKTAFGDSGGTKPPELVLPQVGDASLAGYDPSAAVKPTIDSASVPGALAAYWQHWKETETAPARSAFTSGAYTSEYGASIGQQLNGSEYRANGNVLLVERGTYSAEPAIDGVWTFSVNNRAALICSTVRIAVTDVAIGRGKLLQTAKGDPWGIQIPPGRYAAVATLELHRTCTLTTSNGGLQVLGIDGDNWANVGVH